jgi:uncharacterized delta-60 repeat protein
LPPGDLDTSFAGNGRKAINFGGSDAAQAVLVQPDGKILLAGGGGPAGSFCAARLRSNGKLDTTFGPGKRKVDFGSPDESAFGASLQPDGRIVLAGDSHVQPAVVRLNRNGTRDTTFSGDGRKLFSWGEIGRVQAVIVLPNGKLLLGGFSGPEGGNVQVARMRADGALDASSFGTAGVATVDFGGDDFGMAMARQANGRIVIAGHSSAQGAVVARLRTTGMLDPDFGTGGKVKLGNGGLRAVLVQPDRKIVVAGNANNPDEMTVTRLNTNGTPDAAFGNQGTTSFKFGNLANPLGGAALQPDGKIVVAGYSQDGEVVAVARLTKTGQLDTGFGSAGKATVDFGVAMFGNAVALQKNGRIVVAGQLSGNDDFAVTRLLG